VLAIGPAGENQTAHGSLVHDAGNGAGQGGPHPSPERGGPGATLR